MKVRIMTEDLRAAWARAADWLRPQYHFLPPANWLNDPNGLIQWRGRYHLFYQHNPFAAAHGQIHWGHAVSDDLARWQDLPVALAPSPGGPDALGCWSGCAAVDDAGRPFILYTGLSDAGQRPCLAFGDDDLVAWEKYPGNPVIAEPPPGMDTLGFRDHSLWREGGAWYQLIGSGTAEQGGMALLYRSDDLRGWEYLHPITDGRERQRFELNSGQIWECPSFFPLGDTHALIISVWDRAALHYSAIFTGRYEELRFAPTSLTKLDYGDRHFYAPQTMLDDRGRRLMWGWIAEGRTREAQARAGWSGVMSLPRQLSLDAAGRVCQAFVPELVSLRCSPAPDAQAALGPDAAQPLPLANGRAVEIELELPAAESGRAGVRVLASPCGREATEIYVDWGERRLVVERGRSSLDEAAERFAQSAPLPAAGRDPLTLRIFVDHSVIEIIADEQTALTTRVYPTRPDSELASVFTRGGAAQVAACRAWQLASIW